MLTWEPPHRLVLSWDISADWKYQPGLGTWVEVRFTAEGSRVDLTSPAGLDQINRVKDGAVGME